MQDDTDTGSSDRADRARKSWAPSHPLDGQWYVHLNAQMYGPVSGHDIQRLILRGQIKGSDLVHPVGGKQWVQAKEEPVLGGLFQAEPRASPKRRGLGIGVGALVLMVLFWLAWPYYALYELSIAMQNGDALALEGQIEWSSVREGLRGDLNVMFLRKLRSDKPDAASGFAAILGPAIVNQIVDGYITPQTIAYLIRTGKPEAAATDHSPNAITPQGQGQAPQFDADEVARLLDTKKFKDASDTSSTEKREPTKQLGVSQVKYAFFTGGPFTFKVEIIPPDAQTTGPLTLIFKWNGDWKLTRIFLPPDAFDAADAPGGEVSGPQIGDIVGTQSAPVQQKPRQRSASLSPSEIDAVRRRISQCWSPPSGINASSHLYVVLRVFLKPDGSLASEPIVVEDAPPPLGPALVESAKKALRVCQPFTMLRPEHYDQWKDLELKFDPQELLRG